MNSHGRHIVSVMMLMMLVAALSFGCATNPVRIIPLVGTPAYPPTDPATVMIFREEPQMPFETLGQIVVDPDAALSIPDMEQKLREAGASMGANAVVIFSGATMRAGESKSEMGGGQIVTAIAVRYKNQ